MEWLDSTFRNYFLISLYYVRNLGKTDLSNGYDALDKFVHLTKQTIFLNSRKLCRLVLKCKSLKKKRPHKHYPINN